MHSPALHQPLEGIKLSCIVGADELPEFIRQIGYCPPCGPVLESIPAIGR